jgi:CheY-like chemotaxis protein
MSPNTQAPVILVVDDDPASLTLIEVILKRSDFTLLLCTSAPEAMRLIQTHHPDVIILDDVMPQQYGGDLCREIKQNPVYAHIPVILFSAGMRVRDPAYLRQTGADHALLKPFLPRELLVAINAVLAAPMTL